MVCGVGSHLNVDGLQKALFRASCFCLVHVELASGRINHNRLLVSKLWSWIQQIVGLCVVQRLASAIRDDFSR